MPGVALRWRIEEQQPGVSLHVRPFLSGRDFHSLHHVNKDFNLTANQDDGVVKWQPYSDLPAVFVETDGDIESSALWYYSFLYTAERDRGLDCMEDLASPAVLHFDLSNRAAHLLLSAGDQFSTLTKSRAKSPTKVFEGVAKQEEDRRSKLGREGRSISTYIARRGDGKTILAGYPWFGDWGRDTFIALRGLLLSVPGWQDVAHDILVGLGEYSLGRHAA